MKTEPKILSVVVTYNALQRDWLYKCLASLESSVLKTDIFVVDNFSTDNTANEIEKKFPNVILIKSQVNLGFAKGNNLGFKKAIEENYDFIFLLNQDAWITETTISSLVNAQLKNEEFGILSPIHYNGEGDNLEELFAEFLLRHKGQGRKFYFDHINGNILQEIYLLTYMHAACWLISRKCFNKVGFFDDILFKQYGEDDNYISRARYFDFKIGVVSKTLFYHDTEFRKTKKTEHSFDNTLLEFNVAGANIFDENAISKIDRMISAEKSNALYYLKRLNFTMYKKYRERYQLKIKQKEIIIKQRNNYLTSYVSSNLSY